MKKSLVLTLALVFILGIAGTAFAANPFTDVPANHWAYASISKLAQAGIIDGYGDGRFIGNNTMTRYEMAQIVAKAMARVDSADAAQRAQIEKLAAEFADELDSLGVRVARLEANADNVKITGEARFSYYDYKNQLVDDNNATLRSRIWISGQVNERWKYGGMLENNGHNFKTNSRAGEESRVSLRRAWVDGSIGVINVTAGRFDYTPVYGIILDDDGDGIKLNYSENRWNIDLFALRPTMTNLWFSKETDITGTEELTGQGNTQVYGAQIGYEFTEGFNIRGAYYKVEGKGDSSGLFYPGISKGNLFEVGLDYEFKNDFGIWGQFIRGDRPDLTIPGINTHFSKNGWAAGLRFGKIERNRVGSFELRGAYYDVPAMATFATTPELDITGRGDGYKGWSVGASFVAAKNIDLNVDYFDFKGQGDMHTDKEKEKLLWSYVRFYF